MASYHQRENLFQLWEANGRRLPFRACKETWNPSVSQVEVETIEIKKWPYGTAWGCFVRAGEKQPYGKIANAGTLHGSRWIESHGLLSPGQAVAREFPWVAELSGGVATGHPRQQEGIARK